MKGVLTITAAAALLSACATHIPLCDVSKQDGKLVEDCSGEVTTYVERRDGRYFNRHNEYQPKYELTSYGKYRSIIRHAGGGDRKTFCRSTRTGVINSTECFTEK